MIVINREVTVILRGSQMALMMALREKGGRSGNRQSLFVSDICYQRQQQRQMPQSKKHAGA